jgi:predicted PurR-regulated permease PerM
MDSELKGTKGSSDLHQIKLFVGFIASVVMVIILMQLKNIFIPFFMALLLYFLFNGVVKKLLRMNVPKFFVLLFLLVFIFIMFYFIGVLMYSSVTSFIKEFPGYKDNIVQLISGIESQAKKLPLLEKIDWTESIDPSAITSIISTTFGSFASFIGNVLLVLIFLMFMLAGRTGLTGRVNKAFDEERADKIKFMVNSIEDQVQGYLLIKTFISLMTGVISGIILFIAGADFVIFSALLIFVLNFIPNFGSVLATLFPVTIGLLKFGFSFRLLLIAAGLMATQFFIGNVVEPKITGKSLNLSPIVILLSLIFWYYVWGIVGMILAVPLTSALKIFFANIPVLKPIAEIISAE